MKPGETDGGGVYKQNIARKQTKTSLKYIEMSNINIYREMINSFFYL